MVDSLDNLLNKLGIYDFVGVLLPGIMAIGFSVILDQWVLNIGLSRYVSTENVFQYLIVSYFVGIVLQECGSVIMKLFDKDNKIFYGHYSLKTIKEMQFRNMKKTDLQHDKRGFSRCYRY